MKRLSIVLIVLALLSTAAFAKVGFQGRPITNNLMIPTANTLNESEILIGIGPIGYGISDNIQVGTNILLFLFQDYNFNIKLSLINSKKFVFGAGLRVDYFNLSALTGDEDKMGFTFLSPFAVITTRLNKKLAFHIGGQYSYITGEGDIEDAKVTSSLSGTRIFAGLEHSMSYKTKFLIDGGYDIEFEGLFVGSGLLMGWEKFRLKFGVTYYNPKGANSGFALPNIGLWWRFKA